MAAEDYGGPNGQQSYGRG